VSVRIVLVDDHGMFRSGVRAELAADPGIEVVGEAADVPSAIAMVHALRPDVVLLDVHLPGGEQRPGGREVLQRCGDLLAADPPVRFLALSVSDAAEDVIAVIRAGARGYVTKTISGAELASAVHRVADGDAGFSPRLGSPVDSDAPAGTVGSTTPGGGSTASEGATVTIHPSNGKGGGKNQTADPRKKKKKRGPPPRP